MSSDNPSTPRTASDPKHDSKHQETLKPSVHCVSHDAVSGSLSRSVDDFRPTVFELRQLALFWYRSIWTERWFEIYLGMTDKFVQPYAHERLLPIREAIGDSAWQQIRDEVDAEIRQEIGEEDWAALHAGHDYDYRNLIARFEAKGKRLGKRAAALAQRPWWADK